MSKNLIGIVILLALVAAAGCGPQTKSPESRPAVAAPKSSKVKIGPNVTLEVRGAERRVRVSASVCLREGALEMLLTRTGKKTHEAVLEADVDARKIHEALLLAGAKPGHPVSWVPQYSAPSGQKIRVLLEYEEEGKRKVVPAGAWVRYEQTGATLSGDWVFSGSSEVDDQANQGRKIYLANEGDLICVSNFETALLDLPFQSSKDDKDRSFVANTKLIPPVGTKVTVILEPVEVKK
jgi:hypothetical protein